VSTFDYYIVDVGETRAQGRVVFWGKGNMFFTRKPTRAMVIAEEDVNNDLPRYDNGSYTRAVLCSVVNAHQGDLMELLDYHRPTANKGEAA